MKTMKDSSKTLTNSIFAAMLAKDLERPPEELLKHPAWGISQKLDGKRILVLTDAKEFKVFNRKGKLIPNPFNIETTHDLWRIGAGYLLDGECIDGDYYVFDAPVGVTDELLTGYADRYDGLKNLIEILEPQRIRIIPYVLSISDKISFYNRLKLGNVEGVMFRHVANQYRFGYRSDTLLKDKFWKSLDAIIFNINRHGKGAVSLALLENGNPIDIGACAVPSWAASGMRVGTVCEIKYLYASDGRRLYQPILIRIRDDKTPDECDISQLQFTNRKVFM